MSETKSNFNGRNKKILQILSDISAPRFHIHCFTKNALGEIIVKFVQRERQNTQFLTKTKSGQMVPEKQMAQNLIFRNATKSFEPA